MITTSSLPPSELLCLGDYDGAVNRLGDDWPGVGNYPSRDGHSDEAYARLLMICGVLTIKLGNITQQSVQAAAKDMLTKSARLFSEHPERQSAWLWLGVVYYLCGEFNEAIVLANGLLAEDTNVDVVFGATMTRAMGETGLKQNKKALKSLASIEMLLPVVPLLVQGKFYLNRGMAHRGLKQYDKAVEDYGLAANLFEEVSALTWEAATVNNLARVYTKLGRYVHAHGFAERALSIFQQLGDKAHEAQAWDESARIYLAEENLELAERHARKLLLGM